MIKINMGCGKRYFGSSLKHIDSENYDHIDHNDILDFPYENIDLIYASHLISYFNVDEVCVLLEYWKKKLKSGGVLRLAVPDFKKICELYSRGISLNAFVGPLYGRMESDNNEIYHKFCYDEQTLTKLLKKLDFRNIRKWDHNKVDHGVYDDHSQAYIPHMDKEDGTLISLNLECEK